jgi:hypothetical protein
MMREVEPYLRHEKLPRTFPFHRDRRGWDERLGLGALRRRSSRQRLGS